MDSVTTIIVALIGSGGIGAGITGLRKSWQAQASAGYERRKKEEQAEEAQEAIGELEAENLDLTSELSEAAQRISCLQQFTHKQQQIIADQAKALATLDPNHGGV